MTGFLWKLILCALAIVLPPVAVYFRRGKGSLFWADLGLAALAIAIFFLLFAGPGLVIYGLAGLLALVGVIWPMKKNIRGFR